MDLPPRPTPRRPNQYLRLLDNEQPTNNEGKDEREYLQDGQYMHVRVLQPRTKIPKKKAPPGLEVLGVSKVRAER